MNDTELFKDVESLCGVTRLAIGEAFTKASMIVEPELRKDAIETLEGLLVDILNMYKPAANDNEVVT